MDKPPCWTKEKVLELLNLPFMDLLYQAQTTHRTHFSPNKMQISTLLSIKTGNCPEDCKYCPQSARYHTGVKAEKLLETEKIIKAAHQAKSAGATRFCMGAAWKNPKERDIPYLEEIIRSVKELGMETCMTLGSLTPDYANRLATAGLDYYNHNLDTSPEFYSNIITTRRYEERLSTLKHIREAGMKICSGGIIGLGEDISDRAGLLTQLANLSQPPESVPINMLIRTPGTPLEHNKPVDPFEFVKVIATARIVMPTSYIRLSAGREEMNDQTQALCFMAGANSIFYGCKLLTATNADENRDKQLFHKLGINQQEKTVRIEDKQLENDIINKIFSQNTELFYNAAPNS